MTERIPASVYHVVDCGDVDCDLCPSAYRDDEAAAIEWAERHGPEGKTSVIVANVTDNGSG
jgi:hypothetical protein